MLRLTIIESPPGEMPEGETLVVGPAGATVGRSAENTWILSDSESKISRSHCEVLYENGGYIIVDTSANGTFLDDSTKAVGRGQKAPLEGVSTIRMGDYLLKVSLEAPAGLSPNDIGSRPDFLGTQASEPAAEVAPDQPGIPLHSVEPDPSAGVFLDVMPETLDDNPFNSPGSAPSSGLGSRPFGNPQQSPAGLDFPADHSPASRPDFGQSLPQDMMPGTAYAAPGNGAAHTAPEPVQQASSSHDIIPDDWYLDPAEHSEPVAPAATPPPPPVPRQAPPAPVQAAPPEAQPPMARQPDPGSGQTHDQGDIEDQLRKALAIVLGPHANGLSAPDLVKVVEEMTSMIAISIPELMAALASRSQFKDHLRLDQTMVRARDNNPLKFCSTTAEALEHMLLNDHPGLLHGRLALEQAFRELAAHQTSLVAALQPSLRETMEQLSPGSVEKVAGSESSTTFALPKGKGKLWDTYLELYNKLAEPERGMLEAKFMRSLGKYYERSLNALK